MEIDLRAIVTDLDKKRSSHCGRKREVATEIPIGDLNDDGGLKKLLDKLQVFGADETDQIFEAFVNFEQVSRDSTTGIAEYIHEFDHRNKDLIKLCFSTVN